MTSDIIGMLCPMMVCVGYIIVAMAATSKPTFRDHNEDHHE